MDGAAEDYAIGEEELRRTFDENLSVESQSSWIDPPWSHIGSHYFWLIAILGVTLFFTMKRPRHNDDGRDADQQREWMRKRRAEMFGNRGGHSRSAAAAEVKSSSPSSSSSFSSKTSVKEVVDNNVQMTHESKRPTTLREEPNPSRVANEKGESVGESRGAADSRNRAPGAVVATLPSSEPATTAVSTVTPMEVDETTAANSPNKNSAITDGDPADANSAAGATSSTRKQRTTPSNNAAATESSSSSVATPTMLNKEVGSGAPSSVEADRRIAEQNPTPSAGAKEAMTSPCSLDSVAKKRQAAAAAAAARAAAIGKEATNTPAGAAVKSDVAANADASSAVKKPPAPPLRKPLSSSTSETNKKASSGSLSISTTTGTHGSKPSSPAKKKKRTADPVQVLTQVLTQLTNWTVKSKSEDGAAGGVLIKMQPRVHGGQLQEIRLSAGDRSKGWEVLSHPKVRASLESIMDTATQKQHMEDLIGLSVRSDQLRWDGLPPHAPPSSKGASADDSAPFDNLVALTSHCSAYSAKSLCRMLHLELSQHMFLTDNSLDEEEGLFSDMFANGKAQRTPLDNFLTLLGRTPTNLSKRFLMELGGCYKELYPKEKATFAELLVRILLSRVDTVALSSEALTALSNLFTLWAPATTVVLERIKVELATTATATGKDFERQALLRPLLCLAAYSLPNAGEERDKTSQKRQFQQEAEALTNYPACIYQRQNRAVHTLLDQAGRTMKAARETSILILKKVAMQDRQLLFAWIRKVIQHNEALATIPHAELLAANGIAALTSSRRFVFGLASTLAGLCVDNLVKKGCADLDTSYLFQKQSPFADEFSACLVRSASGTKSEEPGPPAAAQKYKGLVEFFFLSCYLARISVYPTMRVESELQQQMGQVLDIVRKAAAADHGGPVLPPGIEKVAKPVVGAVIGMQAAMTDRDIVAIFTKITLLQLHWIRELASSRKTDALLRSIPDWLCKDPAVWLAHVSVMYPPQFTPRQAENVVEFATELLRYGTSEGTTFSPVVLHLLVKIMTDFARAGYHRAKQQQRKGKFSVPDDDIFGDTSVYTSFDKHNIGVTVYTNRLVCTELCPVLIQTFSALDIVEGLDVDREHGFDKFRAKVDIVDLMLRLWGHPNGECRRSVIELPPSTLQRFGKSISAAIGYMLDDACHKLTDIAELRRSPRPMNRRLLDPHMRSVGSSLHVSRMLFLLFTKLSDDDRPAAAFGNMEDGELATMIAHFVDLTTGSDGGLHVDMDGRRGMRERSASYLARLEGMQTPERDAAIQSLFEDRHFLWTKLGFDVSLLCHHMLALAARWNDAASKQATSSPDGYSAIVSCLASNDDYTDEHYHKLFERYVNKPPAVLIASNMLSAEAMLRADGWLGFESRKSNSERDEDIEERRQAGQCQMKVANLKAIANHDLIAKFLDEVRDCREKTAAAAALALGKLNINVGDAESAVLSVGGKLSEAGYGESLREWLVSSEPFARSGAAGGPPTFAHYYDSTARSRGVTSTGKILVKEARRCHKNLPVPHPNSASFVCFAEERMDLSRAVITGPVDTPYAHGLFLFDVFFPSAYPQIPPLMTFMTTGGGQTRFNPNLYQDGKVCLSLLNTWHAADNSQKWNPKLSSLAQILLSIQTQLLVEEPYFNEPGYEQRRGTEAGRSGSARYNANLRLATLRHGILAPLREPPSGFEEVSRRHFVMCRQRILVQARRWMLETKRGPSKALFPRFERAYHELLSLLSKMKEGDDDDSIEGSTDTTIDCLSPLRSDVKALRDMGDVEFLRKYCGDLLEQDRKPTANQAVQQQGRRRVIVRTNGPSWDDQLGILVVCCVYGACVMNNPWNGLEIECPWLQQQRQQQGDDAMQRLSNETSGDDDNFDEIYQ